jgi:hypothetical protein
MDDVAGTLAEIDRTGVERALVHAPHAAAYDSRELWGVIIPPAPG